MATGYPGDLGELAFVESYANGALRKPQVVADALLRSLVLSGQNDRLILLGLLAEQLAEACRRLTAVHGGLADRRFPLARVLAGPLPGRDEWTLFVQQAATFTPEQMVRDLSLGEDALPSAQRLRAQPDLAALGGLVGAAEGGSAMLLLPPVGSRDGGPASCWFAGIDRGGEPVAAVLGSTEGDAATLADLTADICGIARGFLGSYLDARRNAGRRD
ncbi:MAG: hypothetical protein HYX53_18130 [Chloroflexi bacterium]|nr:hypothetical protein [Chloroflexota bacterium]